MKKIAFLLFIPLLFISCKNNSENSQLTNSEPEIAYLYFGDSITKEGAVEKELMLKNFQNITVNDTLSVKFTATINEVCQKKGCWMKLDLGNESEAFVKFKDYAFFMPFNSAGQEVTVEGKAFVSEVSVEEQRHYAEDAGQSQEEIALITEPKRTLSFEASGVMLKE